VSPHPDRSGGRRPEARLVAQARHPAPAELLHPAGRDTPTSGSRHGHQERPAPTPGRRAGGRHPDRAHRRPTLGRGRATVARTARRRQSPPRRVLLGQDRPTPRTIPAVRPPAVPATSTGPGTRRLRTPAIWRSARTARLRRRSMRRDAGTDIGPSSSAGTPPATTSSRGDRRPSWRRAAGRCPVGQGRLPLSRLMPCRPRK
jgi:hypothetical protein